AVSSSRSARTVSSPDSDERRRSTSASSGGSSPACARAPFWSAASRTSKPRARNARARRARSTSSSSTIDRLGVGAVSAGIGGPRRATGDLDRGGGGAAWARVEAQPAAHLLAERAGDEEAEPEAAPGRLGREVRLAHPREELRRHPAPLVGHAQ